MELWMMRGIVRDYDDRDNYRETIRGTMRVETLPVTDYHRGAKQWTR
jgi:hypothetical protein